MTLESKLCELIEIECEKLMLRYHAYHNSVHLRVERKQKRTTKILIKEIRIPDQWKRDQKFNPFYVYKRRKQISRALARKIENETYKPNPPFKKQISKSSGGTRELAIYQIPDAVVSKYLYETLLAKNRHRFSAFSYAYRNDRNVHFAIQDIAIELKERARIFIAEFDFSKFFDSIKHSYLFEQFSENGFLITEREKNLIFSFLHQQEKGIPQGTSVSLFLANLVCWKLDKNLERSGLQFARYADDTVIWSTEYNKINRALELMFEFARDSSVNVNLKKSDGISLLCHKDMPVEIARRKENIDFLGYSISAEAVSIKKKSVNRIKRQISYILYSNLLQPLREKAWYNPMLPNSSYDPSVLPAISEIRRYMYGDLTGVAATSAQK